MSFNFFKKTQQPEPVVSSITTSDTSVSLTPKGKEKAESMGMKSPYFEILATLLEAGGTANHREIASQVKWPVSKVEIVVKSLARSDYVKIAKIG